jgi:hypothetical protein
MELSDRLKKLADKQFEIAKNRMDAVRHEPRGFNELGEICAEIFEDATGDGKFRKEATGSDLINTPAPLQLITQPTALRDLTFQELNDKPLSMPLESLIDLVKADHVYINLIQYDEDDMDGTKKFLGEIPVEPDDDITPLTEQGKRNLDTLITKLVNFQNDKFISSKIYIMSAMRKPVFDKMRLWNSNHDSYLKDRDEFYSRVERAEEACRQYYDEHKDFQWPGIPRNFRGRDRKNISAAYHYAYLKSARRIIQDDIQADLFGKDSIIEKLIDRCYDFGKKIKINSDGDVPFEAAARSFARLAHYLRVFHTLHTVQITGSWGGIWNRPFEEYKIFCDVELTLLDQAENPGAAPITSSIEYQTFLASLLKESGHLDEYLYSAMTRPPGEKYDFSGYHITQLIKTLAVNKSVYDELLAITPIINGYYKNAGEYDIEKIKKAFNRYNKCTSALGKGIVEALGIAADVSPVFLPQGATISAAIEKVANAATVASERLITPIIRRVYMRDPNNRTAFLLHDTTHKN